MAEGFYTPTRSDRLAEWIEERWPRWARRCLRGTCAAVMTGCALAMKLSEALDLWRPWAVAEQVWWDVRLFWKAT